MQKRERSGATLSQIQPFKTHLKQGYLDDPALDRAEKEVRRRVRQRSTTKLSATARGKHRHAQKEIFRSGIGHMLVIFP